MNSFIYNAMSVLYAVEDIGESKDKASEIIKNLVSILTWGFTAIGVIICIFIGFKFAMAKTPEDKKACKDRLIWFIIGTAIVLSASIVWALIQGVVMPSD